MAFKEFNTDIKKRYKDSLDIIKSNKILIKKLLKLKKKSFKNFVYPFMDMGAKLDDAFTNISNLNSVMNSKETRNIMSKLLPRVVRYSTELKQNKEIYKTFLEISKTKLNETERKVVDNNLLAFKLKGVHLDDENVKRVKEIDVKLSELSEEFSRNLLDSTNNFELVLDDDKCIEKMPDHDKAIAKSLTPNGKYKFTLHSPSYIAFMTYCSDRKLREKMYKAYMTRAMDNSPIITEILALRYELARLLGYKNFAELNNETMSAKSYEDVIMFLEYIAKVSHKTATNELKLLARFASLHGIEKIESYDTAYLSNLLKVDELKFDESAYLPYFEVNNVIDGLLKFISKMFAIGFVEDITAKRWHKSVKVYKLTDSKKSVFARIYLDLFTRKEKRGGAWMNNWHSYHHDSRGRTQLPTAFIVANFSPSTDELPSFLKHDDISTLFHEMGHTLHHIFSKVREYDVSGVSGVDWDTIEFPSQFLEMFSYEADVLKSFAKHYYTGKKLSNDMIDLLVDNKNFQSAMFLLRQVEFALFDMKIHVGKNDSKMVHKILKDVRNKVALIKPPNYVYFENGFSHIFAGGYAAGYYSYKWAEVLSADAFLEFKKQGVFNKTLAKRLKDSILSKGGSASMDTLYIDFLGRKPNQNSLLINLGINP